jgi:flagellar hook-basal body complex protein FliE
MISFGVQAVGNGYPGQGDQIRLNATNPRHFGVRPTGEEPGRPAAAFGRTLRDAFNRVNDLQRDSDRMTRAMAVDPDSVDIHDVTIAAEKARLSLTLTKSIVDRVTQAYRELINLR